MSPATLTLAAALGLAQHKTGSIIDPVSLSVYTAVYNLPDSQGGRILHLSAESNYNAWLFIVMCNS